MSAFKERRIFATQSLLEYAKRDDTRMVTHIVTYHKDYICQLDICTIIKLVMCENGHSIIVDLLQIYYKVVNASLNNTIIRKNGVHRMSIEACLINIMYGDNRVSLAALIGNLECIKIFIQTHQDIFGLSYFGMIACDQGHLWMARLLSRETLQRYTPSRDTLWFGYKGIATLCIQNNIYISANYRHLPINAETLLLLDNNLIDHRNFARAETAILTKMGYTIKNKHTK